MTIEIQNVQRLRVYSEATFAADATSSPGLGSFVDVPFREGSLSITLTTDSLSPQTNQQSRLGYPEEVLGKRSATMSITMNLAPFGAAVTASSTSALATILKAVMGGERKGNASTVATGNTARNFIMTTATGYNVGGACGWVNDSGLLETREVLTKTSNTLTLKYGFSAAPSAGTTILTSSTYYFTEDPQESLQFLVEGAESDDRWLLLGGQCVGGMTLNLDPKAGDLPSVTFNFTFADYKESDETAGTVTGALGTASFTGNGPIVGEDGEFRIFTTATTTYSTAHALSIAAENYAPVVSYVQVTSPSGTNTVKRWRAGRGGLTGSFTTFFEGLTWFQGRDSKADYQIWRQLGREPGGTVVLSCPSVQVKNPQRTGVDELAGQTVEFVGRRDEVITALSTAQAKSNFRIHLL